MKKRKSVVTFLMLAICLVSLSCEETGETILDPIQPIIIEDASTQAIGSSSEQKLAQTFTINRNAELTGFFLPLDCSSGELIVELRDISGSEPGTTVLNSQIFEAGSFVTDVTIFKLFSLPATSISAGDRLTLVINNISGTCGISSAPIGDSYPGGEAFYDSRPNSPGWVRFSEFDSTAQDLPFHVLLESVE